MKIPATYPTNLPMAKVPEFVHEIPDVLAIHREVPKLPRSEDPSAGWAEVGRRTGLRQDDAFHLQYFLETEDRIEATPENVAALRADGLRWEWIAVRVGLASGGAFQTTKVRNLYSEATGFVAETSRAKDGRGFAEALEGPKKLTPAEKKRLAAIRAARKAGVRGDRKVLAVAKESLKKNRPAKKEATA